MAKGRPLSDSEIYNLQVARYRARTDLVWLCNNVLGHKDVKQEIQGAFIRHLQKFPAPPVEKYNEYDRWTGSKWDYKPFTPLYDLPGHRRVLILDPRGFLKTTVNVVAHTIQWIINYPDIAMMIIQSTTEKAEDFLAEVKLHFQSNPTFRALFPEHCPTKRIFEWGTKKEFTTEGRNRVTIRKEATVMTGSIDKGSAGYHFDVMKFSDIVEDNNSRTVQMNKDIIRSFGMMENLLVRPDSWIDVEGTIYHMSDLYTEIMGEERQKPVEQRIWQIHVRGCYKKAVENPLFTPEELDAPLLLDHTKPAPKDVEREPDLRRISWWPERFPTEKLEAIRLHPVTSETFPSQRLNDPRAIGARMPFPVNDIYPTFITRKDFRESVVVSHYDIAIDTAETQNIRSNYTAMSVGAWDRFGRCYVVEICHGKFTPDEIIANVIRLYNKYKPFTIKIEETAFVRGLMAAFGRYTDLKGIFLPFEMIKRDNQTTKEERILNTLQPWYKAKEIRFVDDFGYSDPEETARIWRWLRKELENFPKYEFNDILDTLSDLFQGKKWFGREMPRPNSIEIDPITKRPKIQASYLKMIQKNAWDQALDLTDTPGPIPPTGGIGSYN